MRNAGIVVPDPATAVTLGNLAAPQPLLTLAGLLTMAVLSIRRIPGAILAGIAVTFALGTAAGIYSWTPQPQPLPALAQTALHLDIPGALRLGLVEILVVFLFVDLFDNIGTTVAVTRHAGLMQPDGSIPRVGRILAVDAVSTMAGAALGTSTVVSYVESSAGIAAGGRTGVTAIVTGLLFLAALIAFPLVGSIPASATAAALILVGAAMLAHLAEIDWRNPGQALPGFLTIAGIPFTFSIANGLALGFTAYCLIHLLSGRARQVPPLLYLLSVLFLARFAFLSAS